MPPAGASDSQAGEDGDQEGAQLPDGARSRLADAFNVLQWNVHWSNHDLAGLTQVLAENMPDIIGLNELTVDVDDMARALQAATRRYFLSQPGLGQRWEGYGTDIFYDAGRFQALEGGAEPVNCSGSRGGGRAVNWLLLQDLRTRRKVVTGGTQLSYCGAEGCAATHRCELQALLAHFMDVKQRHPDAVTLWMGDLNSPPHSSLMRELAQGFLGGDRFFQSEDLARTHGCTYFSGGQPVDHILGEAGAFWRLAGGRTRQGAPGEHLAGADHFPVHARVIAK